MKKIFVLMLALISFVGCNNDGDIDIDIEMPSMWDEIEMKMEKTDLSALEVLKSADYWQATKIYYYTLPNAEGEERCSQDVELNGGYRGAGGDLTERFNIISDNKIRFYRYMGHPFTCDEHRMPNIYWDCDLEIVDNTITSVTGSQSYYDDDKTYSFKIIAYDENSVLIESNFWSMFASKIAYPYGRLLFERQTVESPDWFDQFEDRDAFYKWHEENCDKPLY